MLNFIKQNDSVRRALNLVFAFTQVLVPFLHPLTGLGHSIASVGAAAPGTTPENPAPYVFSIWSLIFLLSLIYAAYQALPSQKNNPTLKAIGLWTWTLFLLGSVWMLLAQVWGEGWYLVVVIMLMLGCAFKAFFNWLAVSQQSYNPWDRLVLSPLLGLFSGWLTMAAFLNLAAEIKPWMLNVFSLSVTTFATITVLPAIILALTVLCYSKGNFWYGFAVLWALVGLIVANTYTYPNPIIAILAVGLCVLVGTVWMASRHSSLSLLTPPR